MEEINAGNNEIERSPRGGSSFQQVSIAADDDYSKDDQYEEDDDDPHDQIVSKSVATVHENPPQDSRLSFSSYSRWLQPQDLEAKAQLFHVDLAQEPFLLGLMKQIAETPMPPNWSEERDHGGGGGFVNLLTHEWQKRHPAHDFFVQQIQKLRAQQHANEQQHDRAVDDQDQLQDQEQAKQSAKQQQQQQQLDKPPPLPASGWMEFYELNIDTGTRTTYYYDFVTRKRQDTHPATRLQGFSETKLANPLVFRGAASLHRKTAIKDLSRLEILCFTSWWTESRLVGPKKKHLRVYFSITTKHFQVVLQESDQVYTISHLIGANGQLLEAWDLHLGARIVILGRLTTLMQASVLTTQWLEYHETNLKRLKQELLKELVKYDLRDHESHTMNPKSRIQCADPHHSTRGRSLRQLLNEIEDLKRRLAHFRPDLVRRFAQPT